MGLREGGVLCRALEEFGQRKATDITLLGGSKLGGVRCRYLKLKIVDNEGRRVSSGRGSSGGDFQEGERAEIHRERLKN